MRNQLKKTKRNIRINNIFADLKENNMKAVVSIIMGSTSDMPVMKKAAEFLNEMGIPFEINAFVITISGLYCQGFVVAKIRDFIYLINVTIPV